MVSGADEAHALGVAAAGRDFGNAGAYQGAVVGNEHDVFVFQDLYGADGLAVARAAGDGDDAFGAAPFLRVVGDRGAFAVAVFGDGEDVALFFDDAEGDDTLAVVQVHAAHAGGVAPHAAHAVFVEAHGFAGVGEEHDVAAAVGTGDVHQFVVFAQVDGDDADAARARVFGERGFFHGAAFGGEDEVLVVGVVARGEDGVQAFARLEWQQVHHRFAFGVAPRLRQFVDFEPVDFAAVGEAEHGVVGVGDDELFDEVFVFDRRCRFAFAATALRFVVGERLRLDVAFVREGDDAVFFGNQVFEREVQVGVEDLGAAHVVELVFDVEQFFFDDGEQALRYLQDFEQGFDFVDDFLEFLDDFVLFEAGQAVQAQVEDGLCLFGGEAVVVAVHAVLFAKAVRARVFGSGAGEHVHYLSRCPAACQQRFFGFCRAGGGADEFDDFVDVGKGNGEAFEDVRPFACLAQLIDAAAGDDFAAVRDEDLQRFFERQQARLAADQRHHVDAEDDL